MNSSSLVSSRTRPSCMVRPHASPLAAVSSRRCISARVHHLRARALLSPDEEQAPNHESSPTRQRRSATPGMVHETVEVVKKSRLRLDLTPLANRRSSKYSVINQISKLVRLAPWYRWLHDLNQRPCPWLSPFKLPSAHSCCPSFPVAAAAAAAFFSERHPSFSCIAPLNATAYRPRNRSWLP